MCPATGTTLVPLLLLLMLQVEVVALPGAAKTQLQLILQTQLETWEV
jgi:hypothetical protein